MEWCQRNLKLVSPPSRGGHQTVVFDNSSTAIKTTTLATFGGADPWGRSCSDLVLVDIPSFDATYIEGEKTTPSSCWPSARNGHSMVKVGYDSAILFGGIANQHSQEDVVLFNDVLMLTLESTTEGAQSGQSTEKDSSSSLQPKWRKLSCNNGGPSARHAHSAVALDETTMLVIGGSDNQTSLNDAYLLNINKTKKGAGESEDKGEDGFVGEWQRLDLGRDFAPPREMASAFVVHNSTSVGCSPSGSPVSVCWCGGKSQENTLLQDSVNLVFAKAAEVVDGTSEKAGMKKWNVVSKSVSPNPALVPGRCCHTVVPLLSSSSSSSPPEGISCYMVAGGFAVTPTGMDPTTDQVLAINSSSSSSGCASGIVVMPLAPSKRTDSNGKDVTLGLGHSSVVVLQEGGKTTTAVAGKGNDDCRSSRIFVVNGLVPNAVEQMVLFELVAKQ